MPTTKRKPGRPSKATLAGVALRSHDTEAAALLGARGGHARAANMSPEERSESAAHAGKAGGYARAAAMSQAERRNVARAAAKARWGNR